MVRLTDRPVMTLDVYRGRKTTIQQQQGLLFSQINLCSLHINMDSSLRNVLELGEKQFEKNTALFRCMNFR